MMRLLTEGSTNLGLESYMPALTKLIFSVSHAGRMQSLLTNIGQEL